MAQAHMNVYFDPFNRDTQTPKIPDDNVEASTGVRCRSTVLLRTINSTFPGKVSGKKYGYYVIIIPGVNQSFLVYKYTINASNALTNDSGIIYVGNNGSPFRYTINEESPQFIFRDTLNNYDSYRTVSAGVQVRSCGPRSLVGGNWFAKSDPIGSHRNWNFVNAPPDATSASGVGIGYFVPKNSYILQDLLNQRQWSRLSSFRVDSQVDMHVQLNNEMVNHHRKFIKAESVLRVDPSNVAFGSEQVVPVDLGPASADDRDVLDIGLDHGFNMWILDLANPNDDTSILIEGVANYELLPRPDSPFTQFVSQNDFGDQDIKKLARVYEEKHGSLMFVDSTGIAINSRLNRVSGGDSSTGFLPVVTSTRPDGSRITRTVGHSLQGRLPDAEMPGAGVNDMDTSVSRSGPDPSASGENLKPRGIMIDPPGKDGDDILAVGTVPRVQPNASNTVDLTGQGSDQNAPVSSETSLQPMLDEEDRIASLMKEQSGKYEALIGEERKQMGAQISNMKLLFEKELFDFQKKQAAKDAHHMAMVNKIKQDADIAVAQARKSAISDRLRLQAQERSRHQSSIPRPVAGGSRAIVPVPVKTEGEDGDDILAVGTVPRVQPNASNTVDLSGDSEMASASTIGIKRGVNNENVKPAVRRTVRARTNMTLTDRQRRSYEEHLRRLGR